MSAKLKRAGILFIVCLLLAGLAIGAYAATGSAAKEKDKLTKNPKQTVGKNWGDKPGVIKPNGTAKPKKNLFNKEDSSGKEATDMKLKADDKAPVGPDKKTH